VDGAAPGAPRDALVSAGRSWRSASALGSLIDRARLQASVAMGIMFGYVTAGLIVTYAGEEICPPLSCDALDLDCHHDLTHGAPRPSRAVMPHPPLLASVPCPR
jgi:hypothetical protein